MNNRVEAAYMGRVSALGCVLCRRIFSLYSPAELHHVAEGSGVRSNFAVAPLCPEHHRGGTGLHGLSVPVFCARYRVPWEKEEGLLVWVAEDLQRAQLGSLFPMAVA